MRRPLLLAALGVAAFLLILAATLPSSLLLRFLPPGLTATGLDGSIWRGSAGTVAWRGQSLGQLRWDCQLRKLFAGRLVYQVGLERADGKVALLLATGFDGAIEITDAVVSLPVAVFVGTVVPPGWSGTLDASLTRMRIENQWPVAIDGKAVVRSLRAPGARGLDIGSYELTLGEGQVGTDAVTGRLRDLGGPLHVRGTLSLKRDRSYLLEGDVAPGPGADERVFRTLSFLGAPDSAGRRPFAIEGTL